jgi:hypothetical protein
VLESGLSFILNFSRLQIIEMDTSQVVRLKEGYLLERIDGEATVYHPTLTTAVYLNDTGALIWELCDGDRSISDIIETLGRQYPESLSQIESDVKTLIRQLTERGIAELR